MAPDAPHDLAIDFGGDQFPVSGSRPRLSWKPPEAGTAPAEYELEIHIHGQPVHDARAVGHLFVDWPVRSLRSGERVRWRVRSRARAEASAWSTWHAFETGLLDEDWAARWITPTDDPKVAHRRPGTRPGPRPALHVQHFWSGPRPSVRHGPGAVRGLRERRTRRHH